MTDNEQQARCYVISQCDLRTGQSSALVVPDAPRHSRSGEKVERGYLGPAGDSYQFCLGRFADEAAAQHEAEVRGMEARGE